MPDHSHGDIRSRSMPKARQVRTRTSTASLRCILRRGSRDILSSDHRLEERRTHHPARANRSSSYAPYRDTWKSRTQGTTENRLSKVTIARIARKNRCRNVNWAATIRIWLERTWPTRPCRWSAVECNGQSRSNLFSFTVSGTFASYFYVSAVAK